MRKTVLFTTLVLVAGTACVPKARFDEAQMQLEECRNDKVAAQGAAAACEEKFDREVQQWDNVETLMSEAMPRALSEFREEREQLLELVPQTARAEIETYLEEFTTSVGTGFERLQTSNDKLLANNTKILAQLEDARIRLEEVGVTTSSIDTTVREALSESRDSQERMRKGAQAVLERIQDFDQKYINDQGSDDRLRLNRKERETIVQFHQEVAAELASLGLNETGSGGSAP